ncbi:O-antigen ligase family protein [Pantoea dispersa]|uniref:O-antigen ligase family protein n=1 Tax=Pantoea dispersa TaxID=59814 RepID=UPI003988F59F
MYLKIIVFLALVTSVPQLYVIPGGTDVPLAFIFSYLLFPTLVSNIKFFIKKKLFVVSIMILLTQIVSLLWSIEISGGFRDISYMLSFWLLISGVYSLHRKEPQALMKILKLFLMVVCFEAITIILFRFLPDVKLSLILSPPMRIILGQNVLDSLVLEGTRNNFYDPEKSGGLMFINANIAACYVGISSFLAYSLARMQRSLLLYAISFILWFSVFFTGSKASAIFAVIIPVFAYTLNSSSQKRIGILLFSSAMVMLLCLLLSVSNINLDNSFLSSTADTTDSRIQIWDYGINSFLSSPVLGQGYGGWMTGYAKISTILYPPHNTIMYMWSKSGILSAFAGVFFIYYGLRVAISSLRSRADYLNGCGLMLLMVSGWLFAHGMGENFGLIGDPHQMILLAICLGINYSATQLHIEESVPDNDGYTNLRRLS